MATTNLLGGLAYANAIKRFGAGVKVKESPAVAIATGPATQILLNNPDRVFWMLMNLSPYYGTIAFNNAVTLSQGLLIGAIGGLASSSVDEDGEVVTYPLWGIESVSGQTWYLMEIVRP